MPEERPRACDGAADDEAAGLRTAKPWVEEPPREQYRARRRRSGPPPLRRAPEPRSARRRRPLHALAVAREQSRARDRLLDRSAVEGSDTARRREGPPLRAHDLPSSTNAEPSPVPSVIPTRGRGRAPRPPTTRRAETPRRRSGTDRVASGRPSAAPAPRAGPPVERLELVRRSGRSAAVVEGPRASPLPAAISAPRPTAATRGDDRRAAPRGRRGRQTSSETLAPGSTAAEPTSTAAADTCVPPMSSAPTTRRRHGTNAFTTLHGPPWRAEGGSRPTVAGITIVSAYARACYVARVGLDLDLLALDEVQHVKAPAASRPRPRRRSRAGARRRRARRRLAELGARRIPGPRAHDAAPDELSRDRRRPRGVGSRFANA